MRCGVNLCLFFTFSCFVDIGFFGDGLSRSAFGVIIWDSLFRTKVRGREIACAFFTFLLHFVGVVGFFVLSWHGYVYGIAGIVR